MKAVVYEGPGQKHVVEVPMPTLREPTDAIVRVTRSSICGTDLHILKGDVATVVPGRVLGHEGVGVVESVGTAVTAVRPGDHVVISCITACGRCPACARGMQSHCASGGWLLGHLLDGTHAEFVRIPWAETSLLRVPSGADEASMVMLSDILPTGFEVGVLKGAVKPGDVVAIVGCGPVGLAALMTAQLLSPAEVIMVDRDVARLSVAATLGATRTVNSTSGAAVEAILSRTGGRGVDVAIEAVGADATFAMCQDIVAAGGHLANVGVHGKGVTLKLDTLWSRNVTITTGLVDGNSTEMLMKQVVSGRLAPGRLVTHRFDFGDFERAYTVFANAAAEKSLKVIVEAAR